LTSIERIVELAERTGEIRNPRVRRMLRRLSMMPDRDLEQMLLRRLTAAAGDEAYDPAAFQAPPELLPEEGLPVVHLGTVVRQTRDGTVPLFPFLLGLRAGHVLVTGATRQGKSMLVCRLLSELQGTKALIIDPVNDPAYASFALRAGYRVLDWRDLEISLFAGPAGVPDEIWQGYAIRNLAEAYFLRDGSKAMLVSLLDHCSRQRPGEPVTIEDLYQALMDLRFRLLKGGREYSFYESLKNRFERLRVNPIFQCSVGHEIRDLISPGALLRCLGMPPDEFVAMVNHILGALSHGMPRDPNPVPELLVVIEESHRVTNRERLKRADVVDPAVLDAARVLAASRVNLVFIDQVPSELPPQIVSNTGTRVVFNTLDGRDLDAVQRSLSLTWEQRAALSQLPRQVCVVQHGNPEWPKPFLLKVADFPVVMPDPAEIEARRKQSRERLTFVPLPTERPAQRAERPGGLPLISAPALDYLREIAKDQFVPASRRDQDRAIPLSQGNALRTELVQAGVIRLEHVNTYGRARRILNTVITDAGYELLRSLGVPCEAPRGRGSWEHRFHQHTIAAWAKRSGYTALIEHTEDGKAVDVALVGGGKRIAAEVLCTGVEKELSNLRDLAVGFDEVWFCVRTPDEGTGLKARIAGVSGGAGVALLSRIQFRLLREFAEDRSPTLEAET
jgi:hypothetical protein